MHTDTHHRPHGHHLPVTDLDRAAMAAHPDACPIRLDSRRIATTIWWSAVALLIVLALPGIWASRHELARKPGATMRAVECQHDRRMGECGVAAVKAAGEGA